MGLQTLIEELLAEALLLPGNSPFASHHYFQASNSAEDCTSPVPTSSVHSASQFLTVSCAERYSTVASLTAAGGHSPCSCHSTQPSIIHCRICGHSALSFSARPKSRSAAGSSR